MKPIFFLTLLVLIVHTSCNMIGQQCTGEHDRIEHVGVDITSVDTVKSNNGRYRHSVTVTPEVLRTEATHKRKCNTKTLVSHSISIENTIDTNSIIVTCDKSFSWYNKRTVPIGENLLEVDIFKDHFNTWNDISGNKNINIDVDSIETGIYNFYINCATRGGETFSDTVSVYYN